MRLSVFFLAVALVAVKPVFAVQTNTPEKAYMQGLALERARRYSEAVKAFDEAIALNPRYAWAYRDQGTCYYYLGDIENARRAYAQYLALNPRDTKTKAFAKSLKRKQAPAQETAPSFAGLFLDVGVSGLELNNSDIKNFLADGDGWDASGPSSSLNWMFQLRGGYQAQAGWDIYGKLGFGPWRTTDITWFWSPGSPAILTLSEWGFGLGGGYHWQFGRHSLGLNADLGPSFLSGAYSISGKGVDGGFDFTSWAIAYEVSANYELKVSKHFGLGLDLGYRLAKFDSLSVTSTWGYAKKQHYSDPYKLDDGSQAYFDNSGPFARVQIRWHSSRL
jgi:hypothetical protein